MPNRQLYDRIERLTKQTLLQLHELEQISEELQKVCFVQKSCIAKINA